MIAVAVYGLYGAATNKWDIHIKIEAGGAFDAFWETIAFIVNGIIFFYSGVACINFIVRYASNTRWNAPCCSNKSLVAKSVRSIRLFYMLNAFCIRSATNKAQCL